MTIGGKSTVYFMIADPVGHTRSPTMFNALFADEKIDAVMVPVAFPIETFSETWAFFKNMRNLKGIIVSVPFKTLAFEHSDHANIRASRVGTANAVIRQADGSFRCDNFDGAGFVEGMKRNNHPMKDRDALLVGAGGAGASIGFCLAEEGARSLTINDVDEGRARQLVSRVAAAFPGCDVKTGVADPTGRNLIVNATPIGLKDSDPLPLAADRLTADMTVVDIIMQPADTKLLQIARERGCTIQYGQHMMDCQMDLLADFLTVRDQPHDH